MRADSTGTCWPHELILSDAQIANENEDERAEELSEALRCVLLEVFSTQHGVFMTNSNGDGEDKRTKGDGRLTLD